MRSNGATHIGNDTFLSVTRDDTAAAHLFTSCMPPEERAATLRLHRRALMLPKSSLACEAEARRQYMEVLEHHLAAQEQQRRQRQQERQAGEKQQKQQQQQPGGAAAAAAAGKTPFASKSASRPSPRVGDSNFPIVTTFDENKGYKTAEDCDTAEALRWPSFCRHSLHASPDGSRVAVLSNVLRHHYLLDLCRLPAVVCEFETSEVVTGAAWHPGRPEVLFLLLCSERLLVVDTSCSHLGVVFPAATQVHLASLLANFQRAPPPPSPAPAPAPSSAPGLPAGPSDPLPTAAAPGSGAPPPAPAATAATPDDHASRNATAAATTTTAASAADSSSETDTEEEESDDDPLAALDAQVSCLEFGYWPNRRGGGRGGKRKGGKAKEKKPSKDTPESASKKKEEEAPQPNSAAADTTVSFKSARSTYAPQRDAASAPQTEEGRLTTTSEANGALTLAGGDGASAAAADASAPVSAEDLVSLCVTAATTALPELLLLLSSSGDVFAIKLDDKGLPAAQAPRLPDGRLRATAAERLAAEAEAARARRATLPHLHRLLSRPPGAADGEEALAVQAALVDPDTGVHAVLVCYNTGVVRGFLTDMPDLLARDCAPGAPHPSAFSVRVGPSVDAVGLLSPAVQSTSALVLMRAVGNVCLLRYAAEAYLIAVPVWDRRRGGWCYYRPAGDGEGAETRQLPLAGAGPEMPPPLAVRVPFDLEGASVALGRTELFITPELLQPAAAAETTVEGQLPCPHTQTVCVRIATLLRAALYARTGAFGLVRAPPAAAAAPAATAPANAKTSSAEALEAVAAASRAVLTSAEPREADAALEKAYAAASALLGDVQAAERGTQRRRAALRERVARLSARVRQMGGSADGFQASLLDCIANRNGVSAFYTANDRLGEIHEALCRLEAAKKQRDAAQEQEQR